MFGDQITRLAQNRQRRKPQKVDFQIATLSEPTLTGFGELPAILIGTSRTIAIDATKARACTQIRRVISNPYAKSVVWEKIRKKNGVTHQTQLTLTD